MSYKESLNLSSIRFVILFSSTKISKSQSEFFLLSPRALEPYKYVSASLSCCCTANLILFNSSFFFILRQRYSIFLNYGHNALSKLPLTANTPVNQGVVLHN